MASRKQPAAPGAVVPKKSAALAEPAPDLAAAFAADAGSGMEGADADSYAIPFLAVLQKGSPVVDEDLAEHIPGAKPGMFFENVSRRMYSGKEGIVVIPCHFRRVFVRWGPRGGEGAGFKGEYMPEAVAEMRAKGRLIEDGVRLYFPREDGAAFDPKKNDRLSDTRNHYVLLYDQETGETTPCVLSLSSTQIKKSKHLMSLLGNQKSAGRPLPTFANMIRVTTVPEANDEGTWHGVVFELAGMVDNMSAYSMAKAFYQSIAKGNATVRYDDSAAPRAPGMGDEGEGF